MQLVIAQTRKSTEMAGRNNGTPPLKGGFNFWVKAG
jgi:hypothetical protein